MKYGRKTYQSQSISKVPRLIIADKTMVKLKYTTAISLTSAGLIAHHIYRGNSLFDPDLSGGGFQPAGFDQWAAFYNRYRVHASSILVKARDNQTSDGNPFNMLLIMPKNDTTPETNYVDAACEPYAKKRFLPTKDAGYPLTVKHYMTTRKIRGISKAAAEDQDYQASISANPLREWYWHIYAQNVNASVVSQDVKVYIELTYYCTFMDRRPLDRS